MNINIGDSIGSFKVVRLIGEGGMSEVYLVQDNLDRQFALKTLSANLSRDSNFRERFKQEAKIMSTLYHSNIVQLHSYFEEDDRFCLVMEYVEGGSLKDLIRKIGPIPEERALKIFSQVAGALSYAHEKGVIHRDIKPSNIMIGKDDEVKVMDFGIARMAESPGLTRTGTQMGTLIYMSPEQIRDSKHIDSKSDVYSLGVTLYEMLTGKSPYDETTES
ncbi:MAG: serine/threonine protein kinase, partial [Candidatus Cloacimonetes bacterium]|nr:serine/threonine protein kinase [Candidatus Cloacimonadota bacterium]